jgi:hypothetical protein
MNKKLYISYTGVICFHVLYLRQCSDAAHVVVMGPIVLEGKDTRGVDLRSCMMFHLYKSSLSLTGRHQMCYVYSITGKR